jgi:hypothetical protein
MTLEMITVSFGKHTISVSLALMPLSFIDVFIGIDHSSLALRHSCDPVAIIAISVLVEESTSTVLLVLEPISGIFTAEFASLVSPICALTMTFVPLPQALILVSVLIELNTETVLLIILPVSDISAGVLPLLSLDAAVFLSLLLLNPVNRSVSAVFLGLIIAHLPELSRACLL